MRLFLLLTISIAVAGCTPTSKIYTAELSHYPNGNLKQNTLKSNGKLNGITRIYREDGSLATAIKYKNGKIDGFKNSYYPDGSAWRVEIYENDHLVEISEYDEKGNMIFEQQNY